MNNDLKKPQIVLCLIAGIGLFLPLLKISAYGESASVSFMATFDTPNIIESGIINSKVVLGFIIATFIVLIVRIVNKDSFKMKMISFILIIASAVLFYINVDKIASVKGIISSMIKYGMGYYISLLCIGLTFLLGLVDILANGKTYKPMDDALFNNLKESSGNYNPTNNNTVTSNDNIENTNVQPSMNTINPQTGMPMTLSDLIKRNSNQSTQSNNDNNSNNNQQL